MSDYAASAPAVANEQISVLNLLKHVDSPVSYLFTAGKSDHTHTPSASDVTADVGLVPKSRGALNKVSGVDAVLNCHNQSTCIPPRLQVSRPLNVYFCKHSSRGGVRFYYLMRDGLHAHPAVRLMDFHSVARADYILYLPNSAPWHKTECNDTSFASRLIVLDEYDLHQTFLPFLTKEERRRHYPVVNNVLQWNFLYFKRSYVRRSDGKFLGYPHLGKRDMFPLTYSVAEAYIQSPFSQHRDIDILCTLRGSARQATRLRVQQAVQRYIDAHPVGLENSVAEQLDSSSRKKVSHEYFSRMRRAKIVVTVNPAQWEGDFRLWEALSSGALVFVDPVMVPHPHPLEHGRHVVFFQQNNSSDLEAKLDHYRANPEEARRIALAGYLHVMTFHRTACSVDYILRTAEVKRAQLEEGGEQGGEGAGRLPRGGYAYTGQSLLAQVRRQEVAIKESGLPGKFEEHALERRHRRRAP